MPKQQPHTYLSVNLNKIALLRNARGSNYPNVTTFAQRALDAGAHGITLHPRPDRRHATPEDVYAITQMMKQYPHAEFNLEGYPSEALLQLAIDSAVHQCTLVPDAPEQLTSDHGWNLTQQGTFLKPMIARLKASGIRVSLFMDANPSQCALAQTLGAHRVELYTQDWAECHLSRQNTHNVLTGYQTAAQAALQSGIQVNAGHDLNTQNLADFLNAVGPISEVSIGHALITEALDSGFEAIIQRYLALCAASRAYTR